MCRDCPEEETRPEETHPALAVEWQIRKYDGEVTPEQVARGEVQPVETIVIPGNMVVNSGINRMFDLLIGAGGQAAAASSGGVGHVFMGVGDSSTAATATDTDLNAATGSSHRQWVVLDNTYPSRSSQTLTMQCTFSTSVANFAWNEMGIEIDNGTSSPGTAALSTSTQKLFNHKVVSAGTKTSAQTWVFLPLISR